MMPKLIKGLTFIELLVAVVILSIIATISVISYQHYTLRANRLTAINTLMAIQITEEQYRATNKQYGNLQQINEDEKQIANNNYQLHISDISAQGYTLTAVAKGTQKKDKQNGTSCEKLVLVVNEGKELKTPEICWDLP